MLNNCLKVNTNFFLKSETLNSTSSEGKAPKCTDALKTGQTVLISKHSEAEFKAYSKPEGYTRIPGLCSQDAI